MARMSDLKWTPANRETDITQVFGKFDNDGNAQPCRAYRQKLSDGSYKYGISEDGVSVNPHRHIDELELATAILFWVPRPKQWNGNL